MYKHNSISSTSKFLLGFGLLFICFVGCLNNELHPIDENTLITIRDTSGIAWSFININHTVYDLSQEQARLLISTLLPMKRSEHTCFPGSEQQYDLTLQLGRNPLGIQIAVQGDKLLFTDGILFFEGGDVDKFYEAIKNFTNYCPCGSESNENRSDRPIL